MLRESCVTKRLGFVSDRFYLIHEVEAKKGLIIEILIANSTIFFQKIGFYKPPDYLLGLQGIVVFITNILYKKSLRRVALKSETECDVVACAPGRSVGTHGGPWVVNHPTAACVAAIHSYVTSHSIRELFTSLRTERAQTPV